MQFELALSVMGVRVGNEVKWPRGAMVRTMHEGVGLSKTWFETAEKMGIEIRYETGAQRLVQDDDGRVIGVVVRGPEGLTTFTAKAVVLGCGGFETNPEWRRRYLGEPGTTPRCAAPTTTTATGCGWRWTSAPCRGASGAAATPRRSMPKRRITACST